MVHEIFINGYIGDMAEIMPGEGYYTLNDLMRDVAAAPAGTERINVKINSGGGFVTEGFAMHDFLAAQEMPVDTEILGTCGSISTVISQAPKSQGKGGVRRMHTNSGFFIHMPAFAPSSPMPLNAKELEAITIDLKKDGVRLVDFYSSVSVADRAWLTSKMDAETTLTSAEAESKGLIDEVIGKQIMAFTQYKLVAFKEIKPNNNTMSELKEEIKAGFASMEKTFLNLFKGRKVNATVKTTEGIDIYFDGVLAEGSPVFANEAMTEPAPDGVHTYDGKLYTVAGGVVTKVEEISNAQTPEQVAAAKIAELEAQVTAAKNETQAAITEKNEILAQANTLKTEFVALKSAIETGGGQTFNADSADKDRKDAKPNWRDQVIALKNKKK